MMVGRSKRIKRNSKNNNGMYLPLFLLGLPDPPGQLLLYCPNGWQQHPVQPFNFHNLLLELFLILHPLIPLTGPHLLYLFFLLLLPLPLLMAIEVVLLLDLFLRLHLLLPLTGPRLV